MVPYVRKSFFKHWKDGMKYLEGEDDVSLNCDPVDIPISEWLNSTYPKVEQYALDMTKKEISQSVEAMFHNLND